MSTKHTPGPWQAQPETDYVPAQVSRLGEKAAIVDVFGDNREQRGANARLIAAAPELLLALRLMLDAVPSNKLHPQGYTDSKQNRANDAARAAIFKAQGQS